MRALYAARPGRRDASSPRYSRPWDDASQNTVGQARQSSAVYSAAAGQGRSRERAAIPRQTALPRPTPTTRGQ